MVDEPDAAGEAWSEPGAGGVEDAGVVIDGEGAALGECADPCTADGSRAAEVLVEYARLAAVDGAEEGDPGCRVRRGRAG